MLRLTLATSAMSSKYEIDEGYEDPCSPPPNMDNLVVLHTGHALDLLGVLRLLRDQLLQLLDRILQLGGLSLTHLEILISLVQLGLEVMDIALSSDQLVLGVLQPGASIVEEVRLHITATVGPHQLIVQLLDVRFQGVVLLKKLAVTLLDVLDEAILGRHLVVVLLQA
jgi:hypothetical protein